MAKITKAQYVARSMRRGRSRAQAEGTWKMMQGQKKAMKPYYALNAKTYKRGIIIEATMDRMGYVTLTPRSKRVREQVARHNLENVGTGYSTVYIQNDSDIDAFKERYLTTAQCNELYEGYTVSFKMDPWEFGHYVGYDFHEVIKPNALRYSYGELPPKKVFMAAYRSDLGGGYYTLLLRGTDASAAMGTTFEDAINQEIQFDNEQLWLGVKQLHKKWERGDDNAGDLASSILGTLDIEWI